MSFELQLDPDGFLVLRVDGQVSVSEVGQLRDQIADWAGHLGHAMNLLIDMTRATPLTPEARVELLRLMRGDTVGKGAAWGGSRLSRAVFSVTLAAAGVAGRCRFLPDERSARDWLAEVMQAESDHSVD